MARALWKGAISFGLVTIPVSLYPAKDSRETLSFHLLHKDDLSRVHNRRVDDAGHEVAFEDVVRGYEFEKGRYVVLGEADFTVANIEATQSIDILHFVEGSQIHVSFYDTPYYTEPSKVGRKAYALLRDTLARTGKVGIGKLIIRERQHLCAVIPDGPVLLVCTLRWPYQLRNASELELPGEASSASEEELKMAEQLVETMAAAWRPDQYRDTYHDDLVKLIQRKVESGQLTEELPAPEPAPSEGEVVDIMELLRQSVERRRSAVAPEPAGTEKETG